MPACARRAVGLWPQLLPGTTTRRRRPFWPEAQALLRLLSRFPEAVSEARLRNEPSIVTRATTEIAKAYNKYYYEHRILDDDPAATAARLQLTDACRQTIKTGLYLIGLDAPERM